MKKWTTERKIRAAYDYRIGRMRARGIDTSDLPSFEDFYRYSEATAEVEGITVEAAAKRRLRSVTYTPFEETTHKNAVDVLREEGMYSRLYRMGGKTAFDKSHFKKESNYYKIGGQDYKSTGTYIMGNVKVEFLSSKDNSQGQYVRFAQVVLQGTEWVETGAVWLQERRGRSADDD